ncbi:DNA-3-methyladenine glycosylase 2 family protein [Mycoplasmatota bacterium WC44]
MKFDIPKEAIEHFKSVDETLYNYIISSDEPYREINPDYFNELIRSIVYQQVSMKAAGTIYSRLNNLVDLTPEGILNEDRESLKSVGLSYRKVDYLKNLSQHVLDKSLDIENINSLSNENAIKMIIQVKGLGVWSAEMFLMFALGRLDVSSYNDLAIKKGIKILYELDDIPTKKEFEKYVQTWSPFNTIAHFYLWQASII